jgi:hypothetical protein
MPLMPRMNIDRWIVVLALVISAITVVWASIFLEGITRGDFAWWKLPLALAVFFGLQFTLRVARQRFSWSEKVDALAFAIVEGVFLAVVAIGWHFRKRETEA